MDTMFSSTKFELRSSNIFCWGSSQSRRTAHEEHEVASSITLSSSSKTTIKMGKKIELYYFQIVPQNELKGKN